MVILALLPLLLLLKITCYKVDFYNKSDQFKRFVLL